MTLKNQEQLALLASHESLISVSFEFEGPAGETGLISVTHFKDLREWDPKGTGYELSSSQA